MSRPVRYGEADGVVVEFHFNVQLSAGQSLVR